MNDQDTVWSAREAAAFLKINIKTFYEFLKQSNIPGVIRVGRTYRILRGPFLDAWASGTLGEQESSSKHP